MTTGRAKVRTAAALTDVIEQDLRAAAGHLDSRRAINALGVYLALHEVDLAISIALGRLRAAQKLIEDLRATRPTAEDYDQV